MRSRIPIFAAILVFVAATAGNAGVYFSGDSVVIAESDTLHENAILTGESVSIYADVFGDVLSACRNYNQYADVMDNVFVACQTSDIMGNAGDILAFAQYVHVKSDSTGDIRGAAQTFEVYGYVDGDVIAAGESVYIAPSAVIKGDVFVGAADLTMMGEVYGDVKGGMEEITIGGLVHGDVEVWAEDIRFTGDGKVLGDLDYHAEKEHDWVISDKVHGRISFIQCEDDDDKGPELFGGFFVGLLFLITAIVSALVLILIWKRGVEGSLVAMDQRLGSVILAGIIGFAATPVVALLALVLVITFPLGLMLIAMYPIALYFGWIIFGIWLGKVLLDGLFRRDVSLGLAALVGVLISGILAYVPFVGWIIALVTTILGMGMFIMQMFGLRTLRTW